MGYDANNDYHQGIGYFAYDEAKVVNIVLKFKLRLLESQVLSKMTFGFEYPFLPISILENWLLINVLGGSSSIWTCRILNFEFCIFVLIFSTAPAWRKQQQIFDIQNSTRPN